MATKAPSSDLRSYLDQRFPRTSERLPDGFVSGANVIFVGWRKLGYLKYLLAAVIMWYIPLLQDQDWMPFLQGSFGQTILFNVGYYILLTLGLSVVVGPAGLLDLGYIAFFHVGCYTGAL